ncbi:PKD domain-containing protein, partial [Methanolobus sp.]|uniref:PKD domain-containing protein n=1 Tax=Methanolobus sp. TaxID=1874737 RepID=UPI0025D086CB
ASIDSITPNPATKGSSVTFTGSGEDTDGSITAYLWTEGSAQLSTEASFDTSDLAVGIHIISFKVQDNKGVWSDEVTTTLTVEAQNLAPTASIVSPVSDTVVTVGSSVTFTGSGEDTDGSITAYLWTEGSAQLSTEASFDTSDLAVGIHIISFKVQDNKGVWSDEVTTTLTVEA